ncbi:MAG: amino acid permease [Halanaeroarchaeum sp.]
MTELERDLGLAATVTVSMGAMIGSGIFVLPGIATKIAGPAVILAYFLAGLLVLPAALSKAEMGTAMPEAGGTYLYIDRAMGPLPGTVAGIGAWFSLVFKSAFALVGLGAYLLLFVPVSAEVLTAVGLTLAVLLAIVNVVGVEQTGRLQATIVSLVVLSLFVFAADGLTNVASARYHPFFPSGTGGLLAATGFVFVSYAGVTKIASVAEEVEDPGRNIPAGILVSVLVMMALYTLVVFVMVGVVPADALGTSLTPMAMAGEAIAGRAGRIGIGIVAVLALTSMANAGILSASRFPLAMSRDALAPAAFARVHDRFRTPYVAIALTGALLVGLIVLVPVRELAKLASAFQILVFALVNAALIAFREADLSWYDPDFRAPAYPALQIAGILGGGVLLTQMGWVSVLGAVGIVSAGIAWYAVYGRERTEREGAALDAIRGSSADLSIERTRARFADAAPTRVLVPVGRAPRVADRDRFREMLDMAADVVRPTDGRVQVVRFEEVPEQLDLAAAAEGAGSATTETATDPIAADLDVDVEFGEVVTHDAKRAIASFVETHDVDVVLGEWHASRWHAELLGADVDWYMNHLDGDVLFLRNRGYGDVDRIVIGAGSGPIGSLETVVAAALARANGATVEFVAPVGDATEDHFDLARRYLDELAAFVDAPTETTVITEDDPVEALARGFEDADLAILGTEAQHVIFDVLFGSIPDRLVERVDVSVLVAHERRSRSSTIIRALLERYVL